MNNNELFDPYNLYKPCDDSIAQAFNSRPTFCQSAHEVQKDDREATNAAVQRLIQATKNHISKGN